MNLVKTTILSIAGALILNASMANAANGYNLLFDSDSQNNGKPLNYNNSGCLIYHANEYIRASEMYVYPHGAGEFYAAGDENACVNVCRGWQSSFTKDPTSYNWESNHMYVHPNGRPIPGNSNTSYFHCKTNYSPFYSYSNYCFKPTIDHDPKKPIPPYVFLVHDSEYAYCDL